MYDGVVKYHSSCINDFILTAQALLEPLFSVLTRFRTGKVIFISDLKECFFEVAIPEVQQDMFRILWFNDDNVDSDIEVWKFKVHV